MQHEPEYHHRMHASRKSIKYKRHKNSYKSSTSQSTTSNCKTNHIAGSNIGIYADRSMWYKWCSDKRNRPTKEPSKRQPLVPTGCNMKKPIRLLDPKKAEYRAQKALPPLPYQSLTSSPHQPSVNDDPIHVDCCHCSTLGDFERSHIKQSTAKLTRILGVPVTRTGYHFRPRTHLDIPSTLEEHPSLSDRSNEGLEEFANICTFSPFGTSLPKLENKGLLDDLHPESTASDATLGAQSHEGEEPHTQRADHEHGDVRSCINFERDSFTTLASLDRVWNNPTITGDSWTDDVLDHFTNILSLDDEETLVFFDGPFDDNYGQLMGDPILGKS